MNSRSTFEFAENGHFGEKVQYNGVSPDEYGGAYAVHCMNGNAYGIEVKYQHPIERKKALKIAERLSSGIAGKLVEHDDDDLRLKDGKRACEFFYYDKGVRWELLYSPNSLERVSQISIWK